MTPYGILYKENIHAFEESIKVWQKKFGLLKRGSVIKLFAVFFLEIILMSSVLILMKQETFLISTVIIVGAVLSAVTYFTVVRRTSKNMARVNFRENDSLKQIVLFEDKLIYTSNYGKAHYFYDEIKCVYEKNGIITIILDKEIIPCSVPFMGMQKGDYRGFIGILKEKTASVYEFGGGNI